MPAGDCLGVSPAPGSLLKQPTTGAASSPTLLTGTARTHSAWSPILGIHSQVTRSERVHPPCHQRPRSMHTAGWQSYTAACGEPADIGRRKQLVKRGVTVNRRRVMSRSQILGMASNSEGTALPNHRHDQLSRLENHCGLAQCRYA